MNRKYRPSTAARKRRASAHRKRSNAADAGVPIMPILICMVAVLTMYLRFSQAAAPQAFRQTVSSLISGEVNLKEAVMVFGNNKDEARGETGDEKENAVLVFGKKILGISKAEEEIQKPQDDEYEPPLPNDFDEIAPVENEKDAVGKSSDRIFTVYNQVCESPSPLIDFSEIEFDLPQEEYVDDTPNTQFKIPSPDIVDDTKYTLPFKCMAPIRGRISSKFGYRDHPIDTKAKFHYGVDIASASGTKIAAFAAGTVVQAGSNKTYGNYVRIDHGNGFTSFYGHMSKITCKKGQWLKIGQEVGKVGSTGNSTGPHLHFEMRKNNMIICPSDYVELSA